MRPLFHFIRKLPLRFSLPLLFLCIQLYPLAFPAFAEQADADSRSPDEESPLDQIYFEWGGHLRAQGSVSWVDDDSFFRPVGTGTFYDGNVDFRLKNKIFFGDWGYFETHYEAVVSGGDTREKSNELAELVPFFFPDELLPGEPINDDRRLFDLTHTLTEEDSYIGYHRLDRLNLTLLPPWGTIRLGRQAITWGNGFIFNPFDLFNPFAPTDILRDYKIGDDMALAEFPIADMGNVQTLYVVRRDPVDDDVDFDEASLAGKLHFAVGTTEFDLLGARHFEDYVVGLGTSGYLKDAAWRVDATWTFLEDSRSENGYLSLVANMDYSWVWRKKNFYGFVEFHFNGLGEDDPAEALVKPEVIERFVRGELFTFGRSYLSAHMRVELHPLLNFFVTFINNVGDPSGIAQPRMVWDISEDLQLTAGASISYGEEGKEFGGFEIPGTDLLVDFPDNVFLWATYFF